MNIHTINYKVDIKIGFHNYINQGNSGDTRGYMLGDMIQDESRNIAFQLQNNFKFKNTKVVWGIDYFRTDKHKPGLY